MQNRLESTVLEVYDELLGQYPESCRCELCRADVLAFVLNHARPRYSGGTNTGSALISVDLQKDQTRAEIAVIVIDAMRRVSVNPRHASGHQP